MGLRQMTGVRCAECGASQPPRTPRACAQCGVEGSLEVVFDLREASRSLDRESLGRREPWLWRFRELLPVDELSEIPPLQVGMTPVYGSARLAAWAGIAGLLLKDEGPNPTGTVEDRTAAVAAALARENGRKVLAAAASPDVAESMAAFCSSFGLRCAVFLPRAELSTVAGALARLGAIVFSVPGDWLEARRVCRDASARHGWFDPSSSPLSSEGAKTLGLEIAEQLGERMPDWIAIPAGPGVAELRKGLEEARGLGLTKASPRLLAVVPTGGAVLPSRRDLAALRASDGETIEVGSAEAAVAAREAGGKAGLLCGARGSLALAGLARARAEGLLPREATALAVVDRAPQRTGEALDAIELGEGDVEDAVAQAALRLGLTRGS